MTRGGQRRAASERKEPRSEDRLRARIFCLCKELGIREDARKILAGSFRADGVESMSGMRLGELYAMERELAKQGVVRHTAVSAEQRAERSERRRQHKRVDGPDSAYASERARLYLRNRAEEYYGSEWAQRIGIFLGGLWLKWEARCERNGQVTSRPRDAMSAGKLLFIPWDSAYLPRNFHHWATEAMKAMIKRASQS